MERQVNETLWYAIMEEKYQGTEEFENEIFSIKPYDWDDIENNSWNFWHKPSGLKIWWYKYPLRAPESNIEISNKQFYAVLKDCMNSIDPRVQDSTFDKWWEKNENG